MGAARRGSPRIKIRLQPAKRRIWEATAAQEQLTLSAFIRKTCDEAATGEPFLTPEEIDDYRVAAEQLRGAGIKLNTLVRDLRASHLDRHSRRPSDAEFDEVREELRAAVARVRALLDETTA